MKETASAIEKAKKQELKTTCNLSIIVFVFLFCWIVSYEIFLLKSN